MRGEMVSEIIPRWLSLDSAASYCSVSRSTMERWIRSCHVYATKQGRHWFVDRLAIDAFMSEPADQSLRDPRAAALSQSIVRRTRR